MGSTLAYWAYHRRLSMDAQKIKQPESNVQDSMNQGPLNRPKRMTGRTESECSSSSAPPEDRRVSFKPDDSSDDDEPDVEQQKEKESSGHGRRRFSLDFLFGKNKKDKQKMKRKRSQSVANTSEDDQHVRELRYPGIHNADFAALYFF